MTFMIKHMKNANLSKLLSIAIGLASLPMSISSVQAQSPAPAPSPITVQTRVPEAAPSLFKKTGQVIFDSAQKKMLHGVNQFLQGSGNATPGTNPAATTDSASASVMLPTASQAPCRSWVSPQGAPVACILCIHGLGLQSNSYEFFGNEQSKRGLAVYAIDVRGFGSWMKANGKTKVNFDDCLLDIKQALTSIRAANPGLPVYILGESMGGAIALRAASMYPDLIDGLISSVPAGERFQQQKTSMKVFLNLLTGVNIANVGNDLVNQATQNSRLKSQWEGDPLARLNLTPQELIQFQDFMNSNHDAAQKVANMPVLFIQGNGDQLVKPEGTWELFNLVAAKDKSFFAVPGEHLIFEEAQTQDAGPRDQNFRVISSWLTAKVGRRNRGWTGNRGAATTSPSGGMGMGRRNIDITGLEMPAQLIDSGDYAKAIVALEGISSQMPGNPNVYALMGRAYYLGGQPDKAGHFFRTAMRMSGRAGGEQARNLNSYLLNLANTAPTNIVGVAGGQSANLPGIPFLGFGSTPGSLAAAATIGGIIGLPPGSRGKIYAFFANWAEQTKGMNDSLTQLSSLYGDKVDITRVNVEDAGASPLVDQFKVGPIPTVVFVGADGRVSSTIIGESSYNNYEQAFRSIDRTR